MATMTAGGTRVSALERRPYLLLAVGFIIAVLVATVWGAIVQTQFNLAGLASLGVDISAGVRLQTTMRDVFSGFTPTYGGYIVAPSLLVAFLVCAWLAKYLPGPPLLWFAIAGGAAIPIGNAVVNFLSPLALLVGATRDFRCTLLMALGGVAAGVIFGLIYLRRSSRYHRHPVA
jgi:hypothetical protein